VGNRPSAHLDTQVVGNRPSAPRLPFFFFSSSSLFSSSSRQFTPLSINSREARHALEVVEWNV
jgi:hypothetical protein